MDKADRLGMARNLPTSVTKIECSYLVILSLGTPTAGWAGEMVTVSSRFQPAVMEVRPSGERIVASRLKQVLGSVSLIPVFTPAVLCQTYICGRQVSSVKHLHCARRFTRGIQLSLN